MLGSDQRKMEFGSIAVSSTSPALTVHIMNVGYSPTGAITPMISGTDSTEFTVANGCADLQPMGSCTISVAFKPTTAGTKTGTLVVSSTPGGNVQVALSGVATN